MAEQVSVKSIHACNVLILNPPHLSIFSGLYTGIQSLAERLRTNAYSTLIQRLRDSHLRVVWFEYRLVLGYIPLLSLWNLQMNDEIWATATFVA
jgi:hypothetical protein